MLPLRIDGGGTTAVFGVGEVGAGTLLYLGPALSVDADLQMLASMQAVGPRPSTPDAPVPASLLSEGHFGFPGEPALSVTQGGIAAPTRLVCSATEADAGVACFTLRDERLQLEVTVRWSIDEDGMVTARSAIVNRGAGPVGLGWLASVAMPLPAWSARTIRFPGRWSAEWGEERGAIPTGRHELRSHGGRPGFDNPGWLVVGDAALDDQHGRALGLHLAWSGDVRAFTERGGAGSTQLQLGVPLEPGEVILEPGDRHDTPDTLFALSDAGLAGLSAIFHRYVRRHLPAWPVRKVHFNSWEAAYFDYDAASLADMASSAAALGIERFVLDDGWFAGRRDDRRALGDWRVDQRRFPDGLGALIGRVRDLGMDFGLWVEPEMVSPDSDLYRAHPDWCLAVPGRGRPTQRHQLVLDLTRPEVTDHLFAALDGLLTEHDIAYLKWDHNRDLFPAFSGRPCSSAQVTCFYQLVDRLRAAHPTLEIEACASGGARSDLALLARTGRIWVSDNTDAVDRLRIHRTAGLFLPPEVIGSHVGASPNPITGRRLSMAYRTRVAMFGHLGIELDPRVLDAEEISVLAQHIGIYKRFRALLGRGRAYRIGDAPQSATGHIIVADDRGAALALIASASVSPEVDPPPVALAGLDPQRRYRVELLEPWPRPAANRLPHPECWRARPIASGAQLGEIGLRLPLMHPETAWLVHLEAVR